MLKYTFLFFCLTFFMMLLLITFKGVNKGLRLRLINLSFSIVGLFFTLHVLWFKFDFLSLYPHLINTLSPLMFLPAPIFYFGVKQMIDDQFHWKKKYNWHFLPFIVNLLELLPFYLLPVEEKRAIAEIILSKNIGLSNHAPGLIPSILIDLLRFFLMAGYFSLAWIQLFKSGFLKGTSINKANKDWIKPTLYCFGLFQVIFLFQYFLNIQYYFTDIFFDGIRAFSISSLLVLTVLYVFFTVTKIRVNFDREENVPITDSISPDIVLNLDQETEVGKIGIIDRVLDEDLDCLKEKLNILFEQEKIYLKSDLQVRDLAKRVGVSPRIMSEVLTRIYGKNFKDLINSFRVSFAKDKIDANYLGSCTVESLAELSGFNSRVTFYNTFKREFSVSPTEYWESIRL